jgi:hypothetical protein
MPFKTRSLLSVFNIRKITFLCIVQEASPIATYPWIDTLELHNLLYRTIGKNIVKKWFPCGDSALEKEKALLERKRSLSAKWKCLSDTKKVFEIEQLGETSQLYLINFSYVKT